MSRAAHAVESKLRFFLFVEEDTQQGARTAAASTPIGPRARL
jgi:hypothetical protein